MESVNTCFFCTDEEKQQSPITEILTCSNIDCSRTICVKHSSKIDPQQCQDCNQDVIVTDQIYSKTTQEYDEYTDEIVLKASRCRVIKLEGKDWKFYSQAVNQLSDEQLHISLQYHKALVSKMELESDIRKVQKLESTIRLNRKAGVISQSTIETTTVKKIKPKKPLDLSALAATLRAAGITPAMMDALKKM